MRLHALFFLAVVPALIAGGCGDDSDSGQSERTYSDTEKKVRPQISRHGSIVRALGNYRMTIGHYPTTEQGLEALVRRPSGMADPSLWVGPYLDDPAELTDPWGNEYRYARPGKTYPDDPNKYDLWSVGPDGVDGTDDDVNHWNVR